MPSPELPSYGEVGRLDEIIPAKKKPEIPVIPPIDIKRPGFWNEMDKQDDERKRNGEYIPPLNS